MIPLDPARPLCFLDFDGVLNHTEWLQHLDDPDKRNHIDPACGRVLARIVARWNCQVVVSSVWRHSQTLANLRDILSPVGISWYRVIGVTPDLKGHRATEIQAWLKQRRAQPHQRFFILDDDSKDLVELSEHLVLISHAVGLQDTDIERVKDRIRPWQS